MTLSAEPRVALRAQLERLLDGRNLDAFEAQEALAELMAESTPRSLQAAFLAALRSKGETPEELAGFARGMLARARAVPRSFTLPCVDTAGTGGDGMHSFNLSTAAALLVASLGIPVAKHGNRSVSSRCGSADLIEALGLPATADPGEAGARLARDGFVFLFAPHFHPALRALADLRRELGVRTVFNLLGPLVNPARPSHQLIGAASPELARRLARAASQLGLARAFVVHGGGFDEATPCGPFQVHVVAGTTCAEHELAPEDFGLARCAPADLAGGDARENAARLVALFEHRERGPLRDALCLNAALVLLLLERETAPRPALRSVAAALDDGRAARFLARLAASGGLP